MKIQKTGAFIALMVLVLSMIPATFAQEAMSVEATNMIEIREVPAVRSATTTEARAMELRKVEEEREQLRSKQNVRAYIAELRDSKGDADFRADRALRVVNYAALVVEELIGKLEAMKGRIEDSTDFMANHPNAIARLDSAIMGWSEIHRALYGVASDNKVTRDEWMNTVMPTLRKIHTMIGDMRSQQRPLIDEWRQHRSKEVAQRISERSSDERVKMRLDELGKVNPGLRARVEAQMKSVTAKANVIQKKAMDN